MSHYSIQANGKLLSLDNPIVMAILNATQDSFYTSNLSNTNYDYEKRVEQFVEEGATIIDIGGMSTRPGASPVSVVEEWNRIESILLWTRKRFPDIWISIDTYRSEIAQRSIDFGADIINDISGAQYDEAILDVVASHNIPYIGMHIKGTPEDMIHHAHYDDVTTEVLDYFIALIKKAKAKGIKDIIIDPGFGFAKDLEHNYQLLAELDTFKILDTPILIGISRKKMIQKSINKGSEDALYGTIAANVMCMERGANILRVHDVAATRDAINVYLQLKNHSLCNN